MKTQDAIEHYGGIPALATALSVTIPAIYQWGEYPPGGRQLQLQHVTKGVLQAEPDCMDRKSEKAQ
jgi:hypothetical protein